MPLIPFEKMCKITNSWGIRLRQKIKLVSGFTQCVIGANYLCFIAAASLFTIASLSFFNTLPYSFAAGATGRYSSAQSIISTIMGNRSMPLWVNRYNILALLSGCSSLANIPAVSSIDNLSAKTLVAIFSSDLKNSL